MQWDGSGIQICQSSSGGDVSPLIDGSHYEPTGVFGREAVPDDVYARKPRPISWRTPDAAFSSSGCDPYSECREPRQKVQLDD